MMLRTDTENPLHEAYAHLLDNGLDGANAQDMSLRLNESLASECVANEAALPSELSEFCGNLAEALRASGQAAWIAELPGEIEKTVVASHEWSLLTAWSVAAKWLGYRR